MTLTTIADRYTAWLTDAPRQLTGFALVRIIFALAMLIQLLSSAPDRHILWGMGAWWVQPEAGRRGWWEPLRLLFSRTDPFWFDVAFVVLLALVLLFLVGWQTRWVTPILLVFWVALSTNSTLLGNGGDTLMRIALLFLVFARLSDRLSIDAWLARRRGRSPRRLLPTWIGNALHNTALQLCVFQILLVYAVSSVLKLQGDEWLDGTALYYALSLEQFQLFPAVSELLWQATPVIHVATWLALGVQLLFPVLVLWRPTRTAAVVLITAMHLGIGLLLGLWPFSLAMIALDLLIVRDASWTRIGAAGAAAWRSLRRMRSTAPATP